ncbi:MAG: hypothetical protein JXR94_13320 [Candidatus Hydrogenedentes bacterium]|nr:hypothetical protein [Candidatus Hydrogenedentota bacterium]
MQKASTFFTEEQRKRIEQAVADAESKTSAEIVPALASASGRYDRPEDIVGVWCGVIAMAAVWCLLPRGGADAASWGFAWAALKLPALIAAVVVGFVIGAVIGSNVGWLRRLFTPRRQMAEEVAEAARGLFFDGRVHHTERATGLLVYLSLFERTAAIIADEAVLKGLGQPALDELCARLTAGLCGGDPAEAVCAVLADAGERLASVLPPSEENPDELANSLIVID